MSLIPVLQACRTETKALLQNIPQEECDLEPQEHCKMETVLVPRYTWCYKQSYHITQISWS